MRRDYDHEAWKRTRANHLRTYPECRVCGFCSKKMIVHHIRYRGPRGQSEISGDLVTLCEKHHDELHHILGSTPTWTAQQAYFEQAGRSYADDDLWPPGPGL
jgi:5-methylcytosine-specific restriction endonuclease McrA